MNNKNKILIGCLALLLVLSVGYALFSDTITINGSATAKGNFQLTTTCDTDVSNVGLEDTGSATDAKITCEDNVVSASATLDYPGSIKWFIIKVENTGSIPAKLKKVYDINNPEKSYCEIGDCGEIVGSYVNNDDETNHVSAVLYPDYGFWEDYSDGPIGLEASFSEEQMDAVLDPGETAYFYIEMDWSYKSTTPGEPLTATFNVGIIWEQVTVE